MTTTRLLVAGVPEHFNLPWQTAAERGLFAEAGLAYSWTDEPGGTGTLVNAVESGEVDAAVVLTEGAMAAIGRDRPLLIEGWWVESPLDWAVHTGPHVNEAAREELTPSHRFAISRFGSGSHLMAHVLADQLGFELNESAFVVCGGITGAVEALIAGDADVFLWDRAMTAPYVRSGTLQRIGIQPTPWPSFVAIRHRDAPTSTSLALRTAMRLAALEGARLRSDPQVATLITERFGLHVDDVTAWLETLRWTVDPTNLVPEHVTEILAEAAAYGLLPSGMDVRGFIA